MSSCRTILKDNTTRRHLATRCHMMPPIATKHSIMPHITKRCSSAQPDCGGKGGANILSDDVTEKSSKKRACHYFTEGSALIAFLLSLGYIKSERKKTRKIFHKSLIKAKNAPTFWKGSISSTIFTWATLIWSCPRGKTCQIATVLERAMFFRCAQEKNRI